MNSNKVITQESFPTLRLPASAHPQTRYLLAVSGGIDSMVMAQLFLSQNVSFGIAHVNFQLRNQASLLDEELVKDWCITKGIPYWIERADTQQYADQHHVSIQVAARQIRYAFFESIRSREQYDYIVTAHHRDDAIETLLFHFFRGTGMQGLQSIPYQNGYIIRPLLSIPRVDIVRYADAYQVPYRNDESNEKQMYTRNKIRLSIIPQLEEIFPSFLATMQKNITRFQDAAILYQETVDTHLKNLIEKRGQDYYIPLKKWNQRKAKQTLLYECLKTFNFTPDQTEGVVALQASQSGSFIESQSHRIFKNRDFFIITSKQTDAADIILIPENVTKVDTHDFQMQCQKVEAKDIQFTNDLHSIYVAADLLRYPLILRKARTGDYLYPFGMIKKKKVSRVLIDAKLSMPEKERVWVLESDKKIVWIVGIKPDNRFRVQKEKDAVMISILFQ